MKNVVINIPLILLIINMTDENRLMFNVQCSMILYLWSFGVDTENSVCEIPHYPVIRMLCAQSLVGDETLVTRVVGAVGSAVRGVRVRRERQGSTAAAAAATRVV